MFKKNMMAKTAIVAMAFAAAVSVSGCGKNGNETGTKAASEITQNVQEAETTTIESLNAQRPNPWVDLKTMAEAEKMAGFTLEVPGIPEEYGEPEIRVMKSEEQPVFELIWYNKEDEEIRIRKAPGTDDISGDYNVYAKTDTVSVGTSEVTVKGNDDAMYLAVWTKDGYTYSIYVEKGSSEDEITGMAEATR